MAHYALFDTGIGPCGIAWSERGILAVRFAESDETKTRERLLRRVPGATESRPTPAVQHAIDGVIALLRGEPRDLTDIVIDEAQIPPFNRKVYAIARTIPPGRTMTYGEIAERLGDKLLARDVGQALGENPDADHHAVPSCAGGGRQDRWFFRPRRRQHETAPADHRGRPARRPDLVREPAARGPGPPPGLRNRLGNASLTTISAV